MGMTQRPWSTRSGFETPEWQRFIAKVRFSGPLAPDGTHCWQWTGAQNGKGYGSFRRARSVPRGRPRTAYGFAYELLVGSVPEGLELDHLCRNRLCVNPAHLEPVTHAENVRRATAAAVRITHCKHGHPFDEANTGILPSGKRQCRACGREKQRRHRAKASA